MAIPWIPILTAGATLLGNFLGSSQKKTDSAKGSTTENTTGVAKTQVTGNTVQNTQQSQTSATTSNQTSAEQQRGSTSRLDDGTLALLTQQIQSGLSQTSGRDATQQRLQEVQGSQIDFDVDRYVNGIMTGARGAAAVDLESGKNAISSQGGGQRNSAADLMKAKLARQAAEMLSGVQANATAQGVQIKQGLEESKTGQVTTLAAQTDANVANLLGALLQARETQAVDSTGVTAGTTLGTTNTTASTTENQTQTQEQATNQTTIGTQSQTGKTNLNSQDWTKFFSSIGDILNSSFE